MSYYKIKEQTLVDIASAIRQKIGSNEKIDPVDMPTKILNIESPVLYVIGQPVEVTLLQSNWNGNTYRLAIEGYNSGEYGLQLGPPSNGSVINTQKMIASALTISSFSTTSTGLNIVISTVNQPEMDLTIWIFGLEVKE